MAKKAKLTLNFDGFEDLIRNIEQAGGTIDRAAESCIKQSAQVMQSEFKNQMKASNVPDDLISRMPPPTISKEGSTYRAEVGYKKGAYDPKNLSDGYKVMFLNYGTPHRSEHGKVVAKGFIQTAKKNAKPKLKKAQKKALETILKRVSK